MYLVSMIIGIELLVIKLILEINTTDRWIVLFMNEIQLALLGTDLYCQCVVFEGGGRVMKECTWNGDN